MTPRMDDHPTGETAPPSPAPPELSYPGLSPQLLARVRQLWSARGLDFDGYWRLSVQQMRGFRALPRREMASSAQVDLVFLFDQCGIWVQALRPAAAMGRARQTAGLDPAQWHGIAAVAARLTEQIAALRVLTLCDLPMPAMQIARSISEDVDMMLAQLARRKLAERFVACRNVNEANDFWRRHIAGGRAFRTVTAKLYDIGLDQSWEADYAQWRQQVLTTLGAAAHSNALFAPEADRQRDLLNHDSLYFSTFRLHELCAYAHLIKPSLKEALDRAADTAPPEQTREARLARLAGPMGSILINQIRSLPRPDPS